ncbi:MAG: ATP-binding protein [Gemmataceae bacterium]|nr:ATP-binding protein [Gemmataceae bacterium]
MRPWTPLRQFFLFGTLIVCVLLGIAWPVAGPSAPLFVTSLVAAGVLTYQLLIPFSTVARLRAFLGSPRAFKVYDELHPRFRFVDFYRALKAFAESQIDHEWIEAHFPMQQPLGTLITPGVYHNAKRPERRRLCIGYETFDFFPNEIFCLIEFVHGGQETARLVVRLCQRQYGDLMEVAAADAEQAARVMEQINRLAAEHSIYRGQFLEIRPNTTPMADYGYPAQPGDLAVKFKQRPRVTEKEIVLDERIHAILRRTLFDFFTHRQRLQELGLPKKRTLLLYGPPGTGKTHTCRYVQTTLNNITTMQVSGHAVTQLSEIGKFARQLHPALVILEDIDLVFTQREINVYATVLGELMDQLDGFTEETKKSCSS